MGGFIMFLIFAILAGGVILGVVNGVKQKNNLKRKAAVLGALEGVYVTHVEGLGLAVEAPCEIYRFNDRILIDAQSHKFEIRYDKLRAAVVKSEQELIEKGKSVVGRAVLGTLLVPGLGTIVGGMSGIGNKKKKGKTHHYLIFNFIDSNGDMNAVTFQDIFTLVIKKFCKDVNDSIANSPSEIIQL
jgi:hypothetical protein